MKQWIKEFCIRWGIDLTKNIAYDRMTLELFTKALKPNSNCIDIGCHKGELLLEMLRLAPHGEHFAFEPIPDYYAALQKKFIQYANVHLYACALNNTTGQTTFQYVRNAPAYSGLKRRDYAITQPDIEELSVEVRRLDDVIPPTTTIHFIKIDVEGGEWGVLQGAAQLLARCKPVTLFEFGLGAANHYGTQPEWVFDFFADIQMSLYTLPS